MNLSSTTAGSALMTFDPPTEVVEPLETRVAFHPFTIGLRRKHIHLLADCAMSVTFQPNEYLFRQGDFANRFYLIETGSVSIEAPAENVVIELVSAGNMVGWSWLFPPYTWHFDARAVERTEALFFYGTILREYCEKDPSLGFELFKRMSRVMIDRLQRARVQMLTAYSKRETAPKGALSALR